MEHNIECSSLHTRHQTQISHTIQLHTCRLAAAIYLIELHLTGNLRRRLYRWPPPNTNYEHDTTGKVFATLVSSVSVVFNNNKKKTSSKLMQYSRLQIVATISQRACVCLFSAIEILIKSSPSNRQVFVAVFLPLEFSCHEECQRNSYCIFHDMRKCCALLLFCS